MRDESGRDHMVGSAPPAEERERLSAYEWLDVNSRTRREKRFDGRDSSVKEFTCRQLWNVKIIYLSQISGH